MKGNFLFIPMFFYSHKNMIPLVVIPDLRSSSREPRIKFLKSGMTTTVIVFLFEHENIIKKNNPPHIVF